MEAALDYSINSSLLEQEEPITILAVDDDLQSMEFLEAQINALGHHMLRAKNGQKALEMLAAHKNNIDVVLMDREMPLMDGLSAIRRMKDNPELRNIPVVMITGSDEMDEMKEGLDAGVFYYLIKPVEAEILRSVLNAALREAQQSRTLAEELGKHKASFNLIETCKFKFHTLAEAESLAAFIAHCFPDPRRVVSGLGELLINAIEHGNLGIGYEKKTKIIDAGTWRAEIEHLQNLPENKGKFASATIAHKDDGIYIVVEDEGDGFDWKKFMTIDPSRAGDNHGRGIAQANVMSFDKLTFNEAGNKAIAFVNQEKQLEW